MDVFHCTSLNTVFDMEPQDQPAPPSGVAPGEPMSLKNKVLTTGAAATQVHPRPSITRDIIDTMTGLCAY